MVDESAGRLYLYDPEKVGAGFLIGTTVFRTPTVGPAIVIVAVCLFVLSLCWRK